MNSTKRPLVFFLLVLLLSQLLSGIILLMRLCPGALAASDWAQVNEDGFGDSDNLAVSCMLGVGSRVYAGTYNAVDRQPMVRRYEGGTGWSDVSLPGFGHDNDLRVSSLAVYDGEIYAGIWVSPAFSGNPGCRVLHNTGGTGWNQVNYSGFQDPDNFDAPSMAVVAGTLYAGTTNDADGCQVFRYDGSGAWTRIAVAGFGDPDNTQARCLVSFGGKLYVGTDASWEHGCQVWCYDPATEQWSRVNEDGFGVNQNYSVRAMTVFNDTLYAGTYNQGQVWRYDGGASWTQINETGFGGGNIVTSLYALGGCLFCGTQNLSEGAEVWRYDGDTWVPLGTGGFGDANNQAVDYMASDGLALFAGTDKPSAGSCEVWKTPLTDPRTGLVPYLKGDTVTHDGTAIVWGHAGVTSPDARVKLFEGYAEVASTAPNEYGNFRFDLSGLSLGKHTYYTRVEMLGNSSTDSNSVTVVYEETSPELQDLVIYQGNTIYWWTSLQEEAEGSSTASVSRNYGPRLFNDNDIGIDMPFPDDPGWDFLMKSADEIEVEIIKRGDNVPQDRVAVSSSLTSIFGIAGFSQMPNSSMQASYLRAVLSQQSGTGSALDPVEFGIDINSLSDEELMKVVMTKVDPESQEILDQYPEFEEPGEWNTIDYNLEFVTEAGSTGYSDATGTMSMYLFTLKVRNPFPPYVDPSGFIYDASTGRRLMGAEVTCQKMGNGKEFSDWPAGEFEQINPEYTDYLGCYGWDVTEGNYRVAVGKNGYKEAISGTVYVPPEVLDLNVGLDRDGLPYTYYFAEGCTRTGFDEWVCLQNPGETDAQATIDYMLGTGENLQQIVAVPAHGRQTVKVNDFVGPDQDVSMRVSSDGIIIAERPMYFDYAQPDQADAWTGGHDAVGADKQSCEWYFAEGCTREGFDEWLCIQNPSEEEAQVRVDYMLGTAETISKEYAVGAKSRFTVSVNNEVGPDQDVSARVVSTNWVPIMAERPMYFNYHGVWTGGHDVAGAFCPTGRWYFAEGCTREGFEEWLSIQNPTGYTAEVGIDYMLGTGEKRTQEVIVNPYSRYTVDVNAFLGPEQDASCLVYSDTPIVCERPMYFNYHGAWTGGHDVMGAMYTKDKWFFAEGCTREGFEEWLCIQNPSQDTVDVHVTYMLGTGENVTRDLTVPGFSRATVNAADSVGTGQDVSALVASEGGRIIVERPMYFSYDSGQPGEPAWDGGHCVVGY